MTVSVMLLMPPFRTMALLRDVVTRSAVKCGTANIAPFLNSIDVGCDTDISERGVKQHLGPRVSAGSFHLKA